MTPDATRALTSREHDLTAALLSHAGYSTTCPPDLTAALLSHAGYSTTCLADLTAAPGCTCGTCRSIDLAYRGVRTPQTHPPTRTIDATTSHSLVSLLLHDEIPTYLDVAPP